MLQYRWFASLVFPRREEDVGRLAGVSRRGRSRCSHRLQYSKFRYSVLNGKGKEAEGNEISLPWPIKQCVIVAWKQLVTDIARAEVKSEVKDTHFSSKAYGQRDSKETKMDGRLQLDILQVMQRDYKLRSYSLNSVCAHFLGKYRYQTSRRHS